MCGSCGTSFKRKYTLKRHLETCTGTKQRSVDVNLLCQVCGFMAKTDSSMAKHMKKMHATKDEKLYECPLCSKRFSKKYHLKNHVKRHNKHRCDICNEHFAHAFELQAHFKIHTGEKPSTTDDSIPKDDSSTSKTHATIHENSTSRNYLDIDDMDDGPVFEETAQLRYDQVQEEADKDKFDHKMETESDNNSDSVKSMQALPPEVTEDINVLEPALFDHKIKAEIEAFKIYDSVPVPSESTGEMDENENSFQEPNKNDITKDDTRTYETTQQPPSFVQVDK